MLGKFAFSQERDRISKGIFTGAIVGGIIGVLAAFLDRFNVLTFPGTFLSAIPVDEAIIGTLLGAFIGGCIGGLIKLYTLRNKSTANNYVANDTSNPNNHNHAGAKFQLREEQLDISKKRVQTGEVTMHKESFAEERNIVVPVIHEELVIEKRVLDTEGADKSEDTEIIRIPVSEERIEIIKHPVILEDVKTYNNKFQETETFEKTLKKEKVHVETTGDIKVINKEDENNQ